MNSNNRVRPTLPSGLNKHQKNQTFPWKIHGSHMEITCILWGSIFVFRNLTYLLCDSCFIAHGFQSDSVVYNTICIWMQLLLLSKLLPGQLTHKDTQKTNDTWRNKISIHQKQPWLIDVFGICNLQIGSVKLRPFL